MLRYGLAAALTQDHFAQFIDSAPESLVLQNFDGVIIDAAMLRHQGARPAPIDPKTVDRWHVPTVWIDDVETVSTPERVDWVTLKMPVQRERLLKALFDCLNPATGSNAAKRKVEPSSAIAAPARAKKSKESKTPVSDTTKVIELIEVVEDGPENG